MRSQWDTVVVDSEGNVLTAHVEGVGVVGKDNSLGLDDFVQLWI
eukprot:COSAG06_NODE_30690_length_534_cov_0.836782_2_plen_43_part_01